MKSTQCGVSEYLIAYAVARMKLRRQLFYVLPTYNLMLFFVQNRFDKSVIQTPYYQQLIKSAVGTAESTGLKHMGMGAIKFVGSNTPNAFVEYPADEVIIDELDRCDQDNLEMAYERLSASIDKRILKVSNPTFSEFGIDYEFQQSDKKWWHIPCPHCNHWLQPDFYQHVVRQTDNEDYEVIDPDYDPLEGVLAHAFCDKCHRPYDRFDPGEWVPETKSLISGYQISKMFSSTNTMNELIARFEKGLVNDTAMQRFRNGDLGLPHTAEGSRIDKRMLDDCIADYNMPQHATDWSGVMGVDVGKFFHIRINRVEHDGRLRAVYIGSVQHPEQVIALAERYRVKVAVIDALPETRISKAIANRIPSMFICYFQESRAMQLDFRTKQVSINRTELLDTVKEAIATNKIVLPRNVASIPEYYDHMMASTRVLLDDRYTKLTDKDTPRYAWIHGSKPDHLFLAEAYAILAYNLRNHIMSRGK